MCSEQLINSEVMQQIAQGEAADNAASTRKRCDTTAELRSSSADSDAPRKKRQHRNEVEEILLPICGDVELALPGTLEVAGAGVSGGDILHLTRSVTDPLETNLGHFWPASGTFDALPAGEFAIVDRLADGINGAVFAYRCTRAGRQPEEVAVKKLRAEVMFNKDVETDERKAHFRLSSGRCPSEEDAMTEVGILRYLAKQEDLPRYLLRMQGVFSHTDGVWLVSELADSGDLLNEVQRQGTLSVAQAKTTTWQILQAVAYLHKHRIGHRDISPENVLLKGGDVRVMDFGAAVCSSTVAGTPLRYFRAAGKDFYRAPECYVPMAPEVEVLAPEDAFPGEVATVLLHDTTFGEVRLPEDARPGAWCTAEVWGYTVPPTDVWSVGVCIFVILVGAPAWRRADLTDPLFAYAHEHGLASLLQQWGRPALPTAAQALIDSMTCLKSAHRPTVADCLEAEWLQELCNTREALHEDEY